MQSETRSLLGLLLWVSLAYPQISYHVNKACGFMSNPSHEVNAFAKHIAMHLYHYPVPVTWGGGQNLELSQPSPLVDVPSAMGICSTAASNARGNRWLPPSNGKSFDAAEKCAVDENVGCCCCWQQRRCLSLSSRFWQQQQGRLAFKQRIAGICAQHKHAGGAPHARTTVPCQNHALGQRSTGVSQGQRSTLSGVTRHRAVICIGAQRGTRP